MMPHQYPWSAETVLQRLNDTKQLIDDNDPVVAHLFTQTFINDDSLQLQHLADNASSYLCGAIVSIKDLFDVKGFVTKAGTTFMAGDKPAEADAESVNKLRKAGAVLIGHTTMTELAYSGLGINPHYGTPESALVPGGIPGGSTSGGAVSVARRVADIALGTDTGGSLRIPAAFNGIVGFKPTQRTVSRIGCKTLSNSLDSVGPMARTVAKCELAYRTIKNIELPDGELENRFVIPTNFGMDDLDNNVAQGFKEAVSVLRKAGFDIQERSIIALDELKTLAVWQLAAVEARSEHDVAYQANRDQFDPRVASRLKRAEEVDAIAYCKTLKQRELLIQSYQAEMNKQILLLPTCPIMPPSLAALEASDDEYYRVNVQVLRNPTIANVMDGCSISIPFTSGNHTIGVMLTANAMHDYRLLDIAKQCEQQFQS